MPPKRLLQRHSTSFLNGIELSSGSIRINDYELQQKMFESLGLTDEEIEAKFGFLVEAYKYGAAPHGGMGIGLDRLAMLMAGCDSLKRRNGVPKSAECVGAYVTGSRDCRRGSARGAGYKGHGQRIIMMNFERNRMSYDRGK